MLAIVGTIPEQDFPLVAGEVALEGDFIHIGERRVPRNRGTPALLAAAIKAGQTLNLPPPFGYLVGDIGLGDGSRQLYDYLVRNLPGSCFSVITFHYLLPVVRWTTRVLSPAER